MKRLLLVLQLLACSFFCKAQTPAWLWAVTQTGGDCYTEAHSVKASPSGDVYISGRFGGTITLGGKTVTANGTQVVSGKFDPSGNYIWLQPHPGNYGTDYNYNIYRDKENNTYTTGFINNMYIDKYDSSGNLIWQVDPNINYTSAYGAVTDNEKNVYVTGEYSGTITLGNSTMTSDAGSVDMFLAKLDSNGNWKWAVSGGGTGYDGGRAIGIDAVGDIYVLGSYSADGTFGSVVAPTVTNNFPNLFITKYDSAGNALRVTTATNCGFDNYSQWWFWQSLAVDSCGNAYVTGYFQDTAKFGKFSAVSAGSLDIFVAKCDIHGNWEWLKNEGGPSSDNSYAIALDKYTDVYIAGLFTNSFQFGSQTITSTATNSDGSPFIAKFANSTGDLQWVQTGAGSGDWSFESVTVDNKGYVYACGTGGYSGNGIFGAYTVGNNVSCGQDNFLVTKLDTTPPRKIVPVVAHYYCPGETTTIPYTVIGSFNNGNVFTAELSDSTGSFESWTVLGSIVDTTNGTITITIPANITPGITYLIRVVSSNPATSSYANGCGSYYYDNIYINDFYVTIGGNVAVKLSDDTTVCAGTAVTLYALGGTSYMWSNGDTTSSIKVYPTGDSTFNVIVDNGGCVKDTSVSVAVTAAPPLEIISSATDVCNGEIAKLRVSGGGSDFTWSPATSLNSTTGDSVSANPTANITYTVTGTDSLGCLATGTQSISIVPAPPLIITPQTPLVCSYQSIALSAPTSGSNYQWSPAAGLNTTTGDTVIATPTATTTYTVAGTDSLGCTATGTDIITIIPAPNIPTITVSVTGDSLISSATTDNQWYFDGVLIPDSTRRVLVIKGHAKGWFSVTVTNEANGCSTTSDSTTAVNQLSVISNQLSIYPNPTSSSVFVKINSAASNVKDWSLWLIDVLGRTLYTKPSLNYSNEIDLSDLPSGVYFITVVNKTDRAVFKVVKQNQ